MLFLHSLGAALGDYYIRLPRIKSLTGLVLFSSVFFGELLFYVCELGSENKVGSSRSKAVPSA